MAALDRKHAEIAHGERIAEHAADIWGWGSPAGQVRARRRAGLILHCLPPDLSGPVLEIGCGTGVFTRQFAAQLPAVVASDLSRPLLQQVTAAAPTAHCCVADAEILPFPDGQFAAVVGSSVIHHLDIDICLHELWRVLRPGGVFAFAEPNMLNPQILAQKNIPYLKERLGDSPDERAFVRWFLARRLRRHGFETLRIYPYDFLHPIVPAPLIPTVSRLSYVIEQMPLLREIAGSLVISARKPSKP